MFVAPQTAQDFFLQGGEAFRGDVKSEQLIRHVLRKPGRRITEPAHGEFESFQPQTDGMGYPGKCGFTSGRFNRVIETGFVELQQQISLETRDIASRHEAKDQRGLGALEFNIGRVIKLQAHFID